MNKKLTGQPTRLFITTALKEEKQRLEAEAFHLEVSGVSKFWIVIKRPYFLWIPKPKSCYMLLEAIVLIN